MRELVYYVAIILDGFIAREDGSFDDFPWDDEFVAALTELYPETFPAPMRPAAKRTDNKYFDAVLMGRHTYQVGIDQGLTSPYPTLDQFVISRTMTDPPDSAVTLVSADLVPFIQELKQQPGLGVWICGGSELATALHGAGLVDRLILKLNPILFGTGIPLFGRSLAAGKLTPVANRFFDSGHALLEFTTCTDAL